MAEAVGTTGGSTFMRRSDARHLMSRRHDVEKRFGVKFSGLEQSINSALCESDLIYLNVSGSKDNVKFAIKYLNLFFGKFTKTITYSSELQKYLKNCVLTNLLEAKHSVVVNSDISGTVRITGDEMEHVDEAVSTIEEFLRLSKDSHRDEEYGENDAYLESMMSANIPQRVKDSLCRFHNVFVTLPGPALQLLISWLHQVYDGNSDFENESHEESILILDNTGADEDPLSTSAQDTTNPPDNRNVNNIDDSVVIIEPSEDEFICITLSDDEDDDAGAATVRNFEESRKMQPNILPVSVSWDQPGTSTQATGIKRKRDSPEAIVPSPDIAVVVPKRKLRPVIIDGSNLARQHGKGQNVFSSKGILLAVNYFLELGHTVTAFVPQYRRKTTCKDTIDQEILEELEQKQLLVFTPSRYVDGRCVSSYDDRMMVQLADKNGGVILTNDQFRDLKRENPAWKEVIEQRSLPYCLVGDHLMIPDDPLGRDGPRIDEFLSFPPTDDTA